MRDYDVRQPLIVIHVPKAAGTSSRKFFENWYGAGFLKHYFNEKTGEMPQKYDLTGLHTAGQPIVLHGHFNKQRNFGVEDYYPEMTQFITILRDPFELCTSCYFYLRKASSNWKDQSRIPNNETIEEYLTHTKAYSLNHFPREVTRDNYKDIIEEYFIEIGIAERLEESMQWIAHKLGKRYDKAMLDHVNSTERDQEVPAYLRDQFVERNQLEFDIYNYAVQKFDQRGPTPANAPAQPG